MAKGISLHVGLNFVDPGHYQGWDGELNACEADAEDMQAIAKSKKFSTNVLLTKSATRQALLDGIADAASALKKDDIFVLSYSGHGGQVPDRNADDVDGEDETWCLHDGEIIDDELYVAWSKFEKGVRILLFSDSCHSGTVSRNVFFSALAATGGLRALSPTREALDESEPTPRFRSMPRDVANRTYRANRDFYNGIQDALPKADRVKVGATVMLISGCQDNQESADGTFNGLFTSNLLRVWADGKFKGDYRAFHKSILSRMPPIQSPHYSVVGAGNFRFEKQRPFTI